MRTNSNQKCEVKCGPISLLLYKRKKDIENYTVIYILFSVVSKGKEFKNLLTRTKQKEQIYNMHDQVCGRNF